MRLIYLENFTFEEKTITIIMMIIYQKNNIKNRGN